MSSKNPTKHPAGTISNESHKSRIIRFFVHRVSSLSVVIFLVGVLWILSFPLYFTRNTYLSENALGPTQSLPTFALSNAKYAIQLSERIRTHFAADHKQVVQFVEQALQSFGVETQVHPYSSSKNHLNETVTCNGTNVYGTLRAPKGTGKESIVLSAPMDPLKCDSLGLALAIMQFFTTVKWLHHDIVFVAADESRCTNSWSGERAFVELTQSNPSTFFESTSTSSEGDLAFMHVGAMREAITLDVSDFTTLDTFGIAILSEGHNGGLPNLDLLNTITKRADQEKMRVFLSSRNTTTTTTTTTTNKSHQSNMDEKDFFSNFFGFVFSFFSTSQSGNMPTTVFPRQQKYETFFRFASNLIVGRATGAHGWLRDFTIFAATLTDARISSPNAVQFVNEASRQHKREDNMRRFARIVEGTVRCLNNLIEKLHQSYFLYLMDSPNSFIGYEEYSAALWVIFAPIFLDCLSIYYANEGRNAIYALFSVLAAMITGVIILAVPLLIKSSVVILSLSTLQFLLLWIASGVLISAALYLFGFPLVDRMCRAILNVPSTDHQNDRTTNHPPVFDPDTVKSFCLMFSGLLVAVLIVIHASIAFVAAVYLYSMSLIANPIPSTTTTTTPSNSRTTSRRNRLWSLLRFVLLLIASPAFMLWWTFVVYCWATTDDINQWANSILSFDKLSSWVDSNIWDLDIYGNLLAYVVCLVMVPVHLIYLRLVCSVRPKPPTTKPSTQQ